MLNDHDRKTLNDAGITDLDELARAAAAFLRTHALDRSQQPWKPLSEPETNFLKAGGARGLSNDHPSELRDNLTTITAEYAHMVVTGLSENETAATLGVSISQVQERIDQGFLYVIQGPSGLICPIFQFSDKGTLPGIEAVLAVLNKQAHPVSVQRFFLTPSADLESTEIGHILSPREWLISEHPLEPVITLAKEV